MEPKLYLFINISKSENPCKSALEWNFKRAYHWLDRFITLFAKLANTTRGTWDYSRQIFAGRPKWTVSSETCFSEFLVQCCQHNTMFIYTIYGTTVFMCHVVLLPLTNKISEKTKAKQSICASAPKPITVSNFRQSLLKNLFNLTQYKQNQVWMEIEKSQTF